MRRKHYAIPPEHGAWAWWIGPLLIGAAAAGRVTPDLGVLTAAALVGFLLRQPVTVLVKVASGRAGRPDIAPAVAWLVVYTVLLTPLAAVLAARGHWAVFALGAAGAPVLAVQLWLVSRREERRQTLLQAAGAGVLALAAPAAYWVCGGHDAATAWLLWALTGLHAASTIVHVRLRLEQRRLKAMPALPERMRIGAGPVALYAANFLLAVALAAMQFVPVLVSLAFLAALAEGLWAVVQPPVGVKPTRIGLRQLAASSTFVLLMCGAYLV
jgi:hypothetical protein